MNYWVEIDLSAVAANARWVKSKLPPRTKFTAVVKSGGYGHGALEIARTALAQGADDVSVAYVSEGIALRAAGYDGPLWVMGASLPEEAAAAVAHGLVPMVDDVEFLSALSKAVAPGKTVDVQVKVEGGLRRWGVPLGGLEDFLKKALDAPAVRVKGVFVHPGLVPGKNDDEVRNFLADFDRELKRLSVKFPELNAVERHAADSALWAIVPEEARDRVRIGNFLYGVNPTLHPIALRSPWRAIAKILRVRDVPSGAAVGYGSGVRVDKPRRVASLPVGFAQGISMQPASRWETLTKPPAAFYALVDGQRCPFLGRVGMSHTVIDVTGVPGVRPGDAAVVPLRRTAADGWPKIFKPASEPPAPN